MLLLQKVLKPLDKKYIPCPTVTLLTCPTAPHYRPLVYIKVSSQNSSSYRITMGAPCTDLDCCARKISSAGQAFSKYAFEVCRRNLEPRKTHRIGFESLIFGAFALLMIALAVKWKNRSNQAKPVVRKVPPARSSRDDRVLSMNFA